MTRDFLSVVALGSAAVLLLDGGGATAAQRFRFAYSKLCPVSWGIYTALGWLGVHALGLSAMLAAAGLVGLVDATLGWRLAWVIGPGRPSPEYITRLRIGRSIALMPLMAAVWAYVGATVRLLVAA